MRKPEKIEQKFAHSRLPQGMLSVLDRRIGQCWEATPGRVITAPSRCRRQVQWAWRPRVSRPAPATCLWPQCDKSRGFGGRAPKDAQHLFVHSFTKLNLANVYATYAEPKQLGESTRPALGGLFTTLSWHDELSAKKLEVRRDLPSLPPNSMPKSGVIVRSQAILVLSVLSVLCGSNGFAINFLRAYPKTPARLNVM